MRSLVILLVLLCWARGGEAQQVAKDLPIPKLIPGADSTKGFWVVPHNMLGFTDWRCDWDRPRTMTNPELEGEDEKIIDYHEAVHRRQMQDYGCEKFWELTFDTLNGGQGKKFRERMENEAWCLAYLFVKNQRVPQCDKLAGKPKGQDGIH